MIYFVTNVSKIQYTSTVVTIPAGEEKEVEASIYNYLNSTFGASGKFTFRTAGSTRSKPKVAKKVEAPTDEEVKPKTRKSRTKK